MSTSLSARMRARPASALLTDEKILSTAVSIIARNGLGAATPAALARESNLSITAIRARYNSFEEFLYWVWQMKSIPLVIKPIFNLVENYLTLSNSKLPELRSVLGTTLKRSDLNQATLEILVTCSFNENIKNKIQKDFYALLDWPTSFNSIKATQQIMMLNVILGLIADRKPSKNKLPEVVNLAHEILISFCNPTDERAMPNVDASHLDILQFKTGDPIKDKIFDSCVYNIRKSGYEKMTTKAIAQTAGVSEGLIFSKFKTKLEIFTESYIAQTVVGFKENYKFVEDLTIQFGEAMADAIFLRENCHPDRTLQRAVYLEQMRLSWHLPKVKKAHDLAVTQVFSEWRKVGKNIAESGNEDSPENQLRIAIPRGAVITSTLLPETYKLPYICLTENLVI